MSIPFFNCRICRRPFLVCKCFTSAGHSRRLRKAYAQLAILDAEMARVRDSNPCPEHAPTSCRIISQRLRALRIQRDRVYRRITAVEDYGT